MRLGPSLHTNVLSVFIENASIWKRSWKRIKTKTHTYHISVNGWKRSKTQQNKNDARKYHMDYNLDHNVQ